MRTFIMIELLLLAVLSASAVGCKSAPPPGYVGQDPVARNSNDIYPNRD